MKLYKLSSLCFNFFDCQISCVQTSISNCEFEANIPVPLYNFQHELNVEHFSENLSESRELVAKITASYTRKNPNICQIPHILNMIFHSYLSSKTESCKQISKIWATRDVD